MLKEKSKITTKYENRMRVSYPDSLYDGVRKWSYRKGISTQDFQRKAVEFYIQHLDMDNMELQNFKNR
jgi:hypothetical protein